MPTPYESVVHMLIETAALHPTREALVCGAERLTYDEYIRCVGGLAQELADGNEQGLAGERVAMVMGNSIDICIATFAIHAARGQVVPLNPLYTARELDEILEDATPLAVIYDEAVRETVAPLAEKHGIAKTIMVGTGGRSLSAWRDLSTFGHFLPAPDPKDRATLQYTGGTTGRAKGVNLTHSAIATNLAQREALLPTRKSSLDEDVERILCVMPLFHVYASSMCLHGAVQCAGSLVILPQYHPAETLDALDRERITVFAGSPTLFTGLMAHENFANTDWSALRLCYSGASALPVKVLEAWQEATGTPVLEGYGQSEAGPVLTYNPVDGPRKAGSVGICLPLTEIEIVDVETGLQVLSIGKQGEIRARGPQIMTGYRNLPEETASTLREGWLYTGDIGEFDTDGYLFIRDRKKEMVIVSGYNVFPREVEEVLYQHDDVREAGVVGVPDSYRGEIVAAFVALKQGAAATEDDLLAHCRQNLAKYKVPAAISIVPDLPKTTVGKVDKKQLKKP